MPHDLAEITPEGKLQLHFHPGQMRAWRSEARCVALIAGAQSGKTSFIPHWLYREIQRVGPGDYLFASPTFQLMQKKALPEFRRLFEQTLRLGKYQSSPTMKFTFSASGARRTFGDSWSPSSPLTQIFFGHARNPDSLESATYKAAVLDEAGQNDFKAGSWEAIQRRLAIADGRLLIATTPYNLGWLKRVVFDAWERGNPEYEVVRFDSTENPIFPAHVFDRARREMPQWRFDMMYRGIFTRPAGQIYSCFDTKKHVIPRSSIEIHPTWRRIVGLDFGQVNTAAVFFAEDPRTRRLYAYKEYGPVGGRTAKQHVLAMMRDEPIDPRTGKRVEFLAYGGAPSEDEWRFEFLAAGFAVGRPPVFEVEVGIDRVYGTIARDELYVFSDLERTLAQLADYAREVDEDHDYEVLEEIEDKHRFHLMDAIRYGVGSVRTSQGPSDQFNGARDIDRSTPQQKRHEPEQNIFGHTIRAGTVRRG